MKNEPKINAPTGVELTEDDQAIVRKAVAELRKLPHAHGQLGTVVVAGDGTHVTWSEPDNVAWTLDQFGASEHLAAVQACPPGSFPIIFKNARLVQLVVLRETSTP